MADWEIQHMYRDSYLGSKKPQDLHFVWNLNESNTIEYGVVQSEYPPPPPLVGPYRTDFRLNRDNVYLMGGLHTSIKGSTEDEMLSIAGRDWLHYLERRHYPSIDYDIKSSGWDFTESWTAGSNSAWFDLSPDEVVKNLLDAILNIDEYCLDFTYDLDAVPKIPNWYYIISWGDTETIYSKIKTLSDAGFDDDNFDNGFDFWMTQGKVFRLGYPYRGNPDNIVYFFQKGDPAIINVEFTNTGPDGTHVLAQGGGLANQLTAVVHYRGNSAEYRRHDMTANVGDTMDMRQLRAYARDALHLGVQPVHEITLTVNAIEIPNFWNIFRPGYFIHLDYDLGWWHIQSDQRIISMDCNISNEGEETITFKLNQWYGRESPAGYMDP